MGGAYSQKVTICGNGGKDSGLCLAVGGVDGAGVTIQEGQGRHLKVGDC